MLILLTIIHVLVCFFLVVVVLLQSGKAADLAGAFGGMGSQTAFGPRGSATVLSKATTIAAGVFMVTSLSLAILTTRNAGTASSVLERGATNQSPAKSGTTPPTAAPSTATPAPAATTAAPNATAPAAAAPSATAPNTAAPNATAPGQTPGAQPRLELFREGETKPYKSIPVDVDKIREQQKKQGNTGQPMPLPTK